MFKKSQRLTRGEFTTYFNNGKRKHFPHLTIITSLQENTKVSVVVSKKVAKSAVKRNTLKRRVYAALRKQYEAKVFRGVIIVVLKPSFASLSRKAAEEFLIASIAEVAKTS